MNPRAPIRLRARDRGLILVIVLLLMTLLTAIALSFAREARIDLGQSTRLADQVQVSAIARSGVDFAMAWVPILREQEEADTTASLWRIFGSFDC